ncbi:MAG: ion transporter [Paludibacteraceae bacterium]|nr:ion transporter [Paludibacteraceae bacterium]
MSNLKKIFLNDRIIMSVIILNSLVIFLQESGVNQTWIKVIDVVCTVIFMIEMTVKHSELGIRGYWSNGWNRLDGILVILSVPSVVGYFIPNDYVDFSVFLILRMLRVFRFFRVFHFFPDFAVIMKNVRLAFKQSFSMFAGFIILLVVAGMVNCSLFADICPEYFRTPLDSIYSMFRLCTVEGWYEIPDAVSAELTAGWGHVVKFYFSALLFGGGIIGLSIVNSIFVDAMVSDNNDEVLSRIEQLQQSINELKKEVNREKN